MKFYDELSKYYDEVFPYSKLTKDFLSDVLKESISKDLNKENSVRVLDIACGSGTYTIELSKESDEAIGIDLDDLMIIKAKEKALENNVSNVKFYVMNMLDIDNIESNFSLAFCIGNSLVHLKDRKEVAQFFNKVYSKLNDGGSLVIQTINFKRILDNNLKGLSTIEVKDTLSFERNYIYEDKDSQSVIFDTTLKLDKENETLKNQVTLLTLKQEEIEKMAKDAGFKDIEFFGNFMKAPFDEQNSIPMICVMKKI